MVEKIVVAPNEVRGYGNIVDNDKDKSDLCFYNSFVNADTDLIDGIRIGIMRMIYQDPNLFFSFHQLEKYLYVNSGDMTLSFDSTNKCLVFDDTTESFSLGFDSTDKVLYIGETGEHDYSIAFSQSSYTASGGSATLEITLLDSNVPVQSASVTVTGSDSSVYTGITNSQGLAEITVSSITGTVTFTASYSNVTATCTVEASQYLFYDDCTTDNTSQYTTFYEIWDAKTTVNTSLSFDTDHYVLTNSNASFSTVCLPVTAGLDDWKLTAKIRAVSSNSDKGGGVGIAQDKEKGVGLFQPNSTSTKHLILYNPNMTGGNVASNVAVSITTNDYNTYELTKDGTSLAFKIYNSGGTQVASKVVTITNSSYLTSAYPALSIAKSDSIYVKEIKLEAL